ncbi:MAG: putative quinol monooxygenase [Desulfomonilia bacterium]
MIIVHVFIHVQQAHVDDFIEATVENARNSIEEPGVSRFDFIQRADDPTRFVLVEVYRDEDAPGRHKETDHYRRWRDSVENMMAEPRSSIRCRNIFPDDANW